MIGTRRFYASRFLVYAGLSYAEKALIFGFPLLVLLATGSRTAYNEVEFMFSIAAVASLFMDGGARIYLLYAYRESGQSEHEVSRIKSSFFVLVRFYLFGIVGVLAIALVFFPGYVMNWLAISARALLLAAIAFLAVWYRIHDRPSVVFAYSIPVYVLGLLLLWIFPMEWSAGVAIALAVPHLAIVCWVLIQSRTQDVSEAPRVRRDVVAAFRYAWPVLTAIIITMIIANFGKVYSFEMLSVDEMFRFSFSQRLSLAVQLAHVSIMGYVAKHLFIDNRRAFHMKIFLMYMAVLIFASCVVLIVSFVAHDFGVRHVPAPGWVLWVMLAYTFIWCLGSYMELYINRMNINGQILKGAIASAIAFVVALFVLRLPMDLRIGVAMACSATVYALLLGFRLMAMRRASEVGA